MASEDGSDQDIEGSYQNSFASLDAATAILDILYKADLGDGTQGAGPEDASEDGEVPPGPPESPTRTQIRQSGVNNWRKSSFPIVNSVRSYQSKLKVAKQKVNTPTWAHTSSAIIADLDKAKAKVSSCIEEFSN